MRHEIWEGSRLLHTPNLLVVGLPMGYETWPMIGWWDHLFDGINIDWGYKQIRCILGELQCIVVSCDRFPLFQRPLTASLLHSPCTVQETVKQSRRAETRSIWPNAHLLYNGQHYTYTITWAQIPLNPLLIEMFWWTMKIYLYLLSFVGTEMARAFEILPHRRHSTIYLSYSILWLLLTSQHKEWVIIFNSLSVDSGQRGPNSPYKPCNNSLYIGIIIVPHIDNTQSTGHN